MAKTMLLCGPSEDVDDLLEVVYSSQCGDELDFDRTQIDDQVMQLGNTAIKVGKFSSLYIGLIETMELNMAWI